MKKNNGILINYEPINFYLFLFKNLTNTIILFFLCSFFVYYIMSSEIGMENYPLIITVCMGVCFLTLIIIRLLFSPFTFIYYLSIHENKAIVKWQKNNKLNKEKFTFTKITSEIVPSGKNNPFLKILFEKTDSSELVLKQYYHPKWKKNKMEEIDKLIRNIAIVQKSLK